MAKLASEFSSGRGGNGGRETTLFKVFLSATCLVSDCQTPYIGICPKPIYDKGKYELKIKDILPPIICNEMGHKISIVFEKTTGDVPVVFRLLDENHDVVAEAGINHNQFHQICSHTGLLLAIHPFGILGLFSKVKKPCLNQFLPLVLLLKFSNALDHTSPVVAFHF
jgi:hypothetical protein